VGKLKRRAIRLLRKNRLSRDHEAESLDQETEKRVDRASTSLSDFMCAAYLSYSSNWWTTGGAIDFRILSRT